MRVKIDDYTRGDFIELNEHAWLLTYDQMEAIKAKGLVVYCWDCNDEQDMRTAYHPVGDVTPETIDQWVKEVN